MGKPQRRSRTSNCVVISYLAGFFDGEGSLGVYGSRRRNGKVYRRLEVSVDQHDPRPLDLLKAFFGGNTWKTKAGTYRWRLTGRHAARMLAAISSYTMVKRSQIVIALEYDKGYLDGEDAERMLKDEKLRGPQ